jgi:hypothetical protein
MFMPQFPEGLFQAFVKENPFQKLDLQHNSGGHSAGSHA